jgi:ribonuclease HI
MIEVKIYTDGACKQNIGIGGWAYLIIKDEELVFEKKQKVIETTNNKCEMLAVINALKDLSVYYPGASVKATVFSDSAYLVNAFVDNWIEKWVSNGWINSEKKPVANKEYWLDLIHLQKVYNVDFLQIPRVSNNFAKRVDQLARIASSVKT